MESNQSANIDTLQEIRDIMNRSSRFISLSGWSGVWAGLSALAGSAVAYYWMNTNTYNANELSRYSYTEGKSAVMAAANFTRLLPYLLLAAVILLSALIGGVYFTWRKAGGKRSNIWNNSSRQMLFAIVIPMLAGGVFCFSLMYHGTLLYIAPACLIFYGLALISGSKYTFADIRYLGILELLLGFINLFVIGYSLLLWTIGFGVLHIIYGILMWNKYERKVA